MDLAFARTSFKKNPQILLNKKQVHCFRLHQRRSNDNLSRKFHIEYNIRSA